MKIYHKQGLLHRTNGPAIIQPDGTKEWYYMGNHHRADGPAIVKPDGSMLWFIKGKQYTEHEFNDYRIKILSLRIDCIRENIIRSVNKKRKLKKTLKTLKNNLTL